MVDGNGDPNDNPAFQEAIEMLYPRSLCSQDEQEGREAAGEVFRFRRSAPGRALAGGRWPPSSLTIMRQLEVDTDDQGAGFLWTWTSLPVGQ